MMETRVWKIAPDCRAERVREGSREVVDLVAFGKVKRLFQSPALPLLDHLWLLSAVAPKVSRGSPLPDAERARLNALAETAGIA